ncbi:MAG: C-terminal helicase domain-containing protein, partial [Niameybacter sp.]
TDNFIAYCEESGESIEVANVISRLMRLRQIALDPALIQLDGESPKTDWILDYIKDNPDEPLIVFSQFTSYLNILYKKLGNKKCVLFTGQQSKEAKFQAVQDFQNGNVNVILVNIVAGGVGITLDRAVTCIFTDHVWSPYEREQAEARFLPTTKEMADSVRGVYYLFMENSVDYTLVSKMDMKNQSVINVNDVSRIIRKLKEGERK